MRTSHKKTRIKKVLLFAALIAFTAYSGYRTHTTGPGISSDRWSGLFWLSMVVLVGSALVSIPRIGRARTFTRRD
ncbi:MAG TPA: hypothetical protein VFJ84_02160 [Candidatus Saccharimonadales bacterium]|nr:hypothetical protein [Candidatus Saccharimonadales bacterium]